jgi:hypothetical protein
VLSPEGPTGGAIRQTIFDDEPDGGVDDTPGVVTARVSEFGRVGVEVLAASGAIMLRVGQQEITRSSCKGIPQVVECAASDSIAVRTVTASWTGPPSIISALANNLGLRKVVDASDTFGGIGAIFAWR